MGWCMYAIHWPICDAGSVMTGKMLSGFSAASHDGAMSNTVHKSDLHAVSLSPSS